MSGQAASGLRTKGLVFSFICGIGVGALVLLCFTTIFQAQVQTKVFKVVFAVAEQARCSAPGAVEIEVKTTGTNLLRVVSTAGGVPVPFKGFFDFNAFEADFWLPSLDGPAVLKGHAAGHGWRGDWTNSPSCRGTWEALFERFSGAKH